MCWSSNGRIGVLVLSINVILFLPCFSLLTQAQGDSNKTIIIGTYGAVSNEKPYGPFAINKYLFEQIGYQVEFRQTPSQRMPYSLKSGAIDAYSSSQLRRSIELEHFGDDGFMQVSYPETVTDIYVYYKESLNWEPSWPPEDDFVEGARGVSLNYNYFSLSGFNILRIGDYVAGYKMVNYGRADYWVDSITSRGDLAKYVKTESDGYLKKHLTHNPLFLTFRDNEEWRKIKTLWDQAYRDLYQQKERYKSIYLEYIPGGRSLVLGPYMKYLNDQFPELAIIEDSVATID